MPQTGIQLTADLEARWRGAEVTLPAYSRIEMALNPDEKGNYKIFVLNSSVKTYVNQYMLVTGVLVRKFGLKH